MGDVAMRCLRGWMEIRASGCCGGGGDSARLSPVLGCKVMRAVFSLLFLLPGGVSPSLLGRRTYWSTDVSPSPKPEMVYVTLSHGKWLEWLPPPSLPRNTEWSTAQLMHRDGDGDDDGHHDLNSRYTCRLSCRDGIRATDARLLLLDGGLR